MKCKSIAESRRLVVRTVWECKEMSRRRKTNVDQLKSFLPTEGFKGVNKMKYSIEYMVSIDFLISQTFAPITTKAFSSHFFTVNLTN